MRMFYKDILVCVFITLFLGGCAPNVSPEFGVKNTAPSKEEMSPQTITVFAQPNLNKITLPAGLVAQSSVIPTDLSPISFVYGKTFKSNTRGSYVVWFVPGKGLIRWKESDASIKTVYEPTEWFYENPFFEFYGDTSTLILIDKKGSEVVWVDLDKESTTNRKVPYPFGTIFAVSPDLNKIVYVEGYRQTVGTPSYLVTQTDGKMLGNFTSQAEIADRSFVAWMPDSLEVVVVEDKNKLVAYSFDGSNKSEIIGKLEDNDEVLTFQAFKSELFITTKKSWISFDLVNRKIVHRLPIEAVSALNRPRLIPFMDESILIEEDVVDFDQTYKRLWMSDWMGKKSIVVPAYGKRVSTISPL